MPRVTCIGDVTLDAGDVSVRLPPGRLRASLDPRRPDSDRDEAFRDGARVSLVGEFSQLSSKGYREGALDKPPGAWLVAGGAEPVERHLARKVAGEALVLFAALSCVLVLASCVVASSVLRPPYY
jgi:hypothetical protein